MKQIESTLNDVKMQKVTTRCNPGTKKFETEYLQIRGDLSLKISGSPKYQNIEKIEIMHYDPLKISCSGIITEIDSRIEIRDAIISIFGYRENKEETKFSETQEAVTAKCKDPDMILYTKDGNVIRLNQVLGEQIIKVKNGSLEYKL